MKAIWKGQVIAETDKDQLKYLRESPTPYVCPWKGTCQYFDVGQGDDWCPDNAWSYPQPLPSAIGKVKKDFTNYVAFYHDVQVTE